MTSRSVLAVLILLAAAATAPDALAQVRRPEVTTASGGVVRGTVTTEGGTIPLGGVLVSLSSDRTAAQPTIISEGDGTFRFDALEPGEYKITATFEGFQRFSSTVTVKWNETAQVPIDLRLAFEETVTVVATTPSVIEASGTIAPVETISGREIEEIGSSGPGGIQAALRLFAAVIEVPGGLSIKGGLPNQASVQIGPGTFVDPATGLSHARLPDDAIESVKVLPNPYSVEFGRFSSGLVVIETRRASDRWRVRLNNLDPAFRTERGSALKVVGVAGFAPRFEVGGPLVHDRLFLQQAVQYRYRATDVPSRPQDELRRSHGVSSYTRLDANISPKHSLIGSLGLFPNVAEQATLGTFTPPPATVDIHSNVVTGGVTERTIWTDALFSETTFEINQYDADVRPQGTAPMELLPSTTLGRFYNRHDRSTGTYQLVHTLSGSGRQGPVLHLFKGGIDLLYNRYDSTSASQPVVIRRVDGTLARRLDYTPPSAQTLNTTDVALFVQDRIQPGARWYVELGGRLDRDGVLGRWNVTPRAGAALLLNPSGSAVLRGGVGLFFERTPSAFGVFRQYEAYTESRYAADGVTLLGPPRLFTHEVAPGSRTSRSVTWDVAYDHRFNPTWSFHVGLINRRGSHEPIVEPVTDGDQSMLLASTTGRSRYRDIEVGVHFTKDSSIDINATYSRAMARADLNAFTGFFDSVQAPVFGVNDYAPAKADVPHRLLMRGRVLPTPNWLVVGILDWRTGLPYSTWNEYLDYVGPRNERRFPIWTRVELGLERRFTFGSIRPWIGVRVDNAFRNFLPTDVQANVTAPDFGSFYNSEYRQLRIQLRFAR